MLEHKARIVSCIQRFVEEQLLPAVSFPNMVLDIAMAYPKHEGDDFKIYVIEINPFAEFAGTGLFSWTKDFATLSGRAPFEFRTCESEHAHRIVPDFLRHSTKEAGAS